MLSVTDFNEFSQDLCAVVPTVILNKYSTAEMTSNLWVLHADAELRTCIKIEDSTFEICICKEI